MSKQTICPECNTGNTPGSKFCSHCGSRLPQSTSILCPKCQAPNPRHNFYCDVCGARLQSGKAPIPPDPEEPEASDLPTSAKMFSLPTRQPGDTGDLDPTKIPDWLKKQQDAQNKPDSDKLPKLSELTPEERAASADLPGWLIDTDSQELLIHSPADITTEHFLHLIRDINEEEREKLTGLLNDPGQEGANLPDWLKNLAQPTPKPADEPPAASPASAGKGQEEEDLDWLLNLDASPADSLAEPIHTLSEEEDDWQAVGDDLPDWLGETGPAGTDLLALPDEKEEFDLETPTQDIPDWLQADSAGTDMLASPKPVESETDLPDWLLGAEQPQPGDKPGEPTPTEAASTRSLTDWLSEFDEEAPAAAPQATLEDDDQPIESQTPKTLTNWLADFEDAEEKDVDETLVEAPASTPSTGLTGWLDNLPETPSDADAEDDLPGTGLTELLMAVEPGEEVAADMSTAVDDLPDWILEGSEPASELDSASIESEDWLTDPVQDPSIATGDTGPLPEWLDELEPEDANAILPSATSELDSALDDLFGKQPVIHTGDLDWLDEPAAPEAESESGPLEEISEKTILSDPDEMATVIDADISLEDNPDWLSELAAFDPNKLVDDAEVMETAVTDSEFPFDFGQPDEEDIIEQTLQETHSEEFNLDDFLEVEEQTSGDWVDIDSILTGKTAAETLPDWLDQLDDAETTLMPEMAQSAEDEEVESIPEWVANLRPGDTGQLQSALPSALFSESDASELLDDEAEFFDAEMPDWLGPTLAAESKAAAASADKDISWLDTDSDLPENASELEAILAELPPAQSPEEMLLKAEIPSWLEDLKPRELTGEAAPLIAQQLESSGPLAGMPQTIAVEPAIAMPRAVSALSIYTITSEQTQQARLLQQLAHQDSQPPQAEQPIISARRVTWLRLLVAFILLAAVFLGLYGPAALQSTVPASVPAPAAALNEVLAQTAGRPILVAFEYTPAYGGELNPEAQLLLAQAAASGSPLLTISQYTAGTAVAAEQTAAYNPIALPLLPGEAMGLRQLALCLDAANNCTSLNGRALSPETAAQLSNVAAIILLTGERSSLVNWVEQVTASSQAPLVVGSTQALAPMVAPYYASGQVSGYLEGLPATIAYQNSYQSAVDFTAADAQYGAQSLVLWAAALILLFGSLTLGYFRKNRNK